MSFLEQSLLWIQFTIREPFRHVTVTSLTVHDSFLDKLTKIQYVQKSHGSSDGSLPLPEYISLAFRFCSAGILTNSRITYLEQGTIRLSFDCKAL